MRIEWDRVKVAANVRRHGVSFGEASELLTQEAGVLEICDHRHSEDEDRFVAVGSCASGILRVAFTEREGDVIRIISARRASKHEARLYRRHMDGDLA